VSLAVPGSEPATGRAVSLRDFGVIYFGNDWFAENRTSSHHVSERLTQRTRVLYIDVPGLRAPKANRRDVVKLCRKLIAAVRGPQRIGQRLWHLSVPQVPFRRLRLVRYINNAIGRLLVRRALRRLRFARTISWFVVPHAGCLAHAFDEAAVVYYCIDDYAALPDVDSALIANMDADLARDADQVFVASSRLLDDKKRLNSTTVLAPHGVDTALFGTAADPLLPVPEVTRTLARPIVGFFGLIEAWIDLDLIGEIAERRPDWTFLMVGRVAVDPKRLTMMSNVRFVGAQPYRNLPNWAKTFDVAIMPYRLTRQVLNSAPLKLREYLATGKPVVAVPLPGIEQFAGLVRTARGTEEFIRQIEMALQSESASARARRMEVTATMTWDARVSEVIDIVEHRIAQKEQRQ
jgi:glycosyltransferase involved in cell wall biosynthesis